MIRVELDLYDGNEIQTLRISESTFITGTYENRHQYYPMLITPLEFGIKISTEQYSQSVRTGINGGLIEFKFDERIWPYLNYYCIGREYRVYNDEEMVYRGRISDLRFDIEKSEAGFETTDLSFDLDEVLVSELYEVDPAGLVLENLVSRPKPYARGVIYQCEPVFEKDVELVYRVTSGAHLYNIIQVRVGGIIWDETDGLTPGVGEWKVDAESGIFTLGSTTLGQEVRCDARVLDWETYTTAKAVTEIVIDSGLEIDEESFLEFDINCPGLIGVYEIDPINKLDLIDELLIGAGGWWGFGDDGKIRIGLISEPEEDIEIIQNQLTFVGEGLTFGGEGLTFGTSIIVSVITNRLDSVNISSCKLVNIILPAWRIRLEYRRNQQPLTSALAGVTDADKDSMGEDGIIAPAYENEDIKLLEPRAVDVPIIRSFFNLESDALAVRDRLALAWGVTRRLYEISYFGNIPLELYDSVYVDYQMLNGWFRVHSIVRSVGGVETVIQVWG